MTGSDERGLRARILADLAQAPAPMAALAARHDVPVEQVRDELRRLRDAGLVRASGAGWRLRRTHHHRPDWSTPCP